MGYVLICLIKFITPYRNFFITLCHKIFLWSFFQQCFVQIYKQHKKIIIIIFIRFWIKQNYLKFKNVTDFTVQQITDNYVFKHKERMHMKTEESLPVDRGWAWIILLGKLTVVVFLIITKTIVVCLYIVIKI